MGSRLADIGSDHAYLPIYLCQRDLILSAIATDVNAGPVKNAEENIALHGLENKISARIGDGMEELDPLEYDTVSVCGMGGELIFRIINNEKVKRFRPKLILQPMSSIQDLSYLIRRIGLVKGEHADYDTNPYVDCSENDKIFTEELTLILQNVGKTTTSAYK